jgi:hypothetical protein
MPAAAAQPAMAAAATTPGLNLGGLMNLATGAANFIPGLSSGARMGINVAKPFVSAILGGTPSPISVASAILSPAIMGLVESLSTSGTQQDVARRKVFAGNVLDPLFRRVGISGNVSRKLDEPGEAGPMTPELEGVAGSLAAAGLVLSPKGDFVKTGHMLLTNNLIANNASTGQATAVIGEILGPNFNSAINTLATKMSTEQLDRNWTSARMMFDRDLASQARDAGAEGNLIANSQFLQDMVSNLGQVYGASPEEVAVAAEKLSWLRERQVRGEQESGERRVATKGFGFASIDPARLRKRAEAISGSGKQTHRDEIRQIDAFLARFHGVGAISPEMAARFAKEEQDEADAEDVND